MNDEAQETARALLDLVEQAAAEMDTRDAIIAADRSCGGAGGSVWAATTYAGRRLLGNGLGDTGSGATWEAALADLRQKHAARLNRLARLDAERLNARDRLRKVLAWGSIAAGAALALWWAWR